MFLTLRGCASSTQNKSSLSPVGGCLSNKILLFRVHMLVTHTRVRLFCAFVLEMELRSPFYSFISCYPLDFWLIHIMIIHIRPPTREKNSVKRWVGQGSLWHPAHTFSGECKLIAQAAHWPGRHRNGHARFQNILFLFSASVNLQHKMSIEGCPSCPAELTALLGPLLREVAW